MDRKALVDELARLYDLTGRLRRECPWDRKQTQESIIAYTLEEIFELADTIRERETRGDAAVCGELGDLLFQVYFLACVAEEQGLYDLGDVAAGIQAKLIRRHPHIFGDANAETPEDVRKTWDAIKRDAEGREGIFHDVPEAFPSTLLAQKLQQRAAAVGFDWEHAPDILDKIKEETSEVEQELTGGNDRDRLAEELGDLLFAVVNLARWLKVDPEIALRETNQRFRKRFSYIEKKAADQGRSLDQLSFEEMDQLWEEAKTVLESEANEQLDG